MMMEMTEKWLLTVSFAFSVASLGGSSTITERLTCTIGTAGISRSLCRNDADCVATTYRCLLLSPVLDSLLSTLELMLRHFCQPFCGFCLLGLSNHFCVCQLINFLTL